MHELSLAGEVIKIAESEAKKNLATLVSEITIEVGNFSGVEVDTFKSALDVLSEGSILDKALLNIVSIKGKGICHACDNEFEMDQRMDTCPKCNTFPSEIKGGHEFRVVSIMIE